MFGVDSSRFGDNDASENGDAEPRQNAYRELVEQPSRMTTDGHTAA